MSGTIFHVAQPKVAPTRDQISITKMVEKVKIGDIIQGLTYTQLLEVEQKLKNRLPTSCILLTDRGGFVAESWDVVI